jgi:predicted glycoside hydrolase/deacetylase ChbG (UPF0249 family)
MSPIAPPRRIVLCVDDCGLHDDIDAAALMLADAGRVSACSVLVDGASWPRVAQALRERARDALEVGLHINLTQALSADAPTQLLPRLLLGAWTHLLDRARLRDALQRQLDRFEHALRRSPDFVDGHQHVQQLPMVRDALLQVLGERRQRQVRGESPWLRIGVAPRWAPAQPPSASSRLKAGVIAALGARTLADTARRGGWATSRALLGVRRLSGDAATLQRDCLAWLAVAQDGDVWMAHPACAGAAADPLRAARECEFALLSSAAFGEQLARARVRIATMRAIVAPAVA